jgi:hypothetical protein
MHTEQVTFHLHKVAATGYLHRFIEVEFDGVSYRVRVKETAHTNTQHLGLLTPGRRDESPLSVQPNGGVLGVYDTLEEANAAVIAEHDRLQTEGWLNGERL